MDSSSVIKNEDLPDIATIQSATVYNSEGNPVFLGSLFDRDSITVISLIRQWNCPRCQAYVEQLGERVPLDQWSRIGAQVFIIGHGEAKHMDAYNNLTHCPFEIYSDPKRFLYKTLKLGEIDSGPPASQVTSYDRRSRVGIFLAGLRNTFKMGSFTSAGPNGQLGGEYIFKTDALGHTECTYARKMPSVRSHTEPEVLYRAAQEAARMLRGTQDGSIVPS